jgi:hypothetical protein
MVQGQTRQKTREIPISANKKLGMVACACVFSFAGRVNRRIMVKAGLDTNVRLY